MNYFRFISDGKGIYEAVDADCPKDDERRVSKPDGSWLPRVGESYAGAISFWTEAGLKKYIESGLQKWHCGVINHRAKVIVISRPQNILYSDEFQIICHPGDATVKETIEVDTFIRKFCGQE